MWNLILSGTSWASTMIGIFQDDFPMFHFRRRISDFNILNHYKGSYWLRDLNIIFNLIHFCSDMKNRGCWKVFIWSLKQLNNTLPSKLILLSLPFLKLMNSVTEDAFPGMEKFDLNFWNTTSDSSQVIFPSPGNASLTNI